ncbi:MAG: hypothetical protein NC033_00120 [Clostridiales bacterium]|nr:hypothetical protein [Clostridiales bacterium]
MKKLTANQQIIADDILRYKKNKLASTLAILGLVFNCLYFLLLYAMPRAEFRTISIGFSVVLTLVMLLTIFLSSEGVKGYNKKFSIVLLVCAAFQILRIFYYPLKGIQNNWFVAASAGDSGMNYIGYFGWYPSFTNPKSTVFFVLMLVYLIASAACLIGSAVWGFIVATRLEKFQKQLDSGEISVETAIKELESEDAEAEVKVAAEDEVQIAPSQDAVAEEVTAESVESVQDVADDKPSSEVE